MFFSRHVFKSTLILFYTVIVTLLIEGKVSARMNFLIERPKLGLTFSYEHEQDERIGPDTERKDATMTFSEKLDIKTGGWVYHPALVTYTLRLSPEWEQLRRSDQGNKKTSRTFLQGYSTEFTFLQYKPYTLNIFANRLMSTLNSSFAERSKTKSDTYGARLMLKYSVLPTTLSYKHQKSTQTGFFSTENERDELLLNMRYDRNLGDTKLEASYTDTTRTTRGVPLGSKQQKTTLKNIYNLTEDKRVILSSGLSYNDTRGDFTKTIGYNVSENLYWKHRKNLTTNYNLRYDRTHFEATSRESKGLGFNLTHLPYEDLTTSFNVTGSSSQSSGTKELFYRAGLNLNYRSKIPWGILYINTMHNYGINERDVTADFIQVIDESITLTTGDITLLVNEHVNIASILVTDNTGTIVYVKDVDYRVTEIGSSVRIIRVQGGGINDGDTVLVDYKYLGNPTFDYSTFTQSYSINLNLWSVWRIYYGFNNSKQRFLSGITPDTLIDDDIHTAGTELEWKWSRTKFEFEDRQTTNVPTTRWRAEETITTRPLKKVFFSLSGNYGKFKFKETGETERFNGIRANIQMLTSNRSRLSLEGFRNKISGRSQKTTDSGISSIFEWFYGIWSGNIAYRFLNEKDEISQETFKNNYFLFEIKRTLF